MTASRILASDRAACCWIPLFALRCEEARRPDYAGGPAAVLSPDDTRRVWQVSPPARHVGVRPGMTVGQAIGLCPALRLCEPDPVHYDEQFASLVTALGEVSPVLEPVELGRVYVGMDGLEGIYGPPEQQVQEIQMRISECGMRNGFARSEQYATSPDNSAFRIPHSTFRLGWGLGKFVSWVAASRAKSGGAVIVAPGDERQFLSAQPLSVLPLDMDTHRRLRRLGLTTLGDLAALPEEAVTSQFGDTGRKLWRLAAGRVTEPVIGHPALEPIVASLTFFTPVAEHGFLVQALKQLLARALQDPRRTGWRVQVVRVLAQLEHGASWLADLTLKDPAADVDRLLAPLEVRLAQAPPSGGVEKLTVEFRAFAPGTTALQLFARDAGAAARAARRDALRSAVQEIRLRFRRSLLQHVIEVQPWSRLPERRYALIDFEP